jgi:hypothetical protein
MESDLCRKSMAEKAHRTEKETISLERKLTTYVDKKPFGIGFTSCTEIGVKRGTV